jgi:hypothetical protein
MSAIASRTWIVSPTMTFLVDRSTLQDEECELSATARRCATVSRSFIMTPRQESVRPLERPKAAYTLKPAINVTRLVTSRS